MKFNFKQVVTPGHVHSDSTLILSDGLIATIEPNTQHHQADNRFKQCIAVPGYIDIQVNGGGGVLFNQSPDAESLARLFTAHQQFGTTAMLPTLITDTVEVMQQAANAVQQARAKHQLGIAGIHFEGPWLDTARKGVHAAKYIRTPSDQELAILRQSGLGKVLVTLAPEHVRPEIISELVADNICVFLGHSNADAKTVELALSAGASGFTHLYNAMSALGSRAPGMVGVAMAHRDSYAGLIVDGFHVDPIACNAAINAKGVDKVALVTDAMALAATTQTTMPFFDTEIRRNNNRLTTPDGTLAGSCLTMADAVKNTVALCQRSVAEAAQMASSTPAHILGLEQHMGQIKPGLAANISILDERYNVVAVLQNGHLIQCS